MTNTNFSFNANEYTQEQASSYTSWVIGKTPCIILAAVEGVGATSGFPHYCVQIEAIAGENKGKRHRMYYVLEHANPKVVQYHKRDLGYLTLACGMQGFNHIAELGGKKFVVDVACYLSKKTGLMTQSFNKFEAYIEPPAAGVGFDPNASAYGAVKPQAYKAKQPNVDTSAPLPDDDIPF